MQQEGVLLASSVETLGVGFENESQAVGSKGEGEKKRSVM